jgi:hypothetical protein
MLTTLCLAAGRHASVPASSKDAWNRYSGRETGFIRSCVSRLKYNLSDIVASAFISCGSEAFIRTHATPSFIIKPLPTSRAGASPIMNPAAIRGTSACA